MALPANLSAFDLKEALCHESIGYSLVGSKPHAYYVSQHIGDVPLQIQKQDGPLRESYVWMMLGYAGVSEQEFLAAHAATVAATAPAPPSSQSPPASSQTTSSP